MIEVYEVEVILYKVILGDIYFILFWFYGGSVIKRFGFDFRYFEVRFLSWSVVLLFISYGMLFILFKLFVFVFLLVNDDENNIY